ncbi:hypothetical protein O3M35_006295 [Rhynocoris fuscipes]|uniref:Uncharacterized protein n=1 Tax=Rhynocoris fuscipes TaxID=488301 RepID=A0AAW1DCX2_9HEMI
MQLFAFDKTQQIMSKFQMNRTNSVVNRIPQSYEFCVQPYLKNGLSQLKIFLYSILITPNIVLINF